MNPRVSLFAFLLLAVIGCRANEPTIDPRLTPKSFRYEGQRLVAQGSWHPRPAGWVPFASIRIECVRAQNECVEFWAAFYADEEGGPGGLVPEVTRYAVTEWTPTYVKAQGIFREKWPVTLVVDVRNGSVVRRYSEKASYDPAVEWTLE